ncbi:hypothetical protein FJR39_20185 [Dolichospermum flos-aquae UHCC 0037]|uniref:Uncharacterized protein n=1 Tax=Dolichospermum flos-aquae UHCC 0037 TaxID=2590026 RepID=A0ACC7SA84_DOLFA|nr:hypothetical protein [Dolichospermum flos-aquae UHCC 0037]
MKIVVMARQKARGKSEEGLGDFTFLCTVWFYCVHLLNCPGTYIAQKEINIENPSTTHHQTEYSFGGGLLEV